MVMLRALSGAWAALPLPLACPAAAPALLLPRESVLPLRGDRGEKGYCSEQTHLANRCKKVLR